jgi:prolyl oligopeptidase
VVASEDRTEAFLSFSSFNYPLTIFRVDLRQRRRAKPWMESMCRWIPRASREQVWYPQGRHSISMFLAYRKGLARSGDAPTMLAGYGGFNASLMPTFSATVFNGSRPRYLRRAQPARRRVRRGLARRRDA